MGHFHNASFVEVGPSTIGLNNICFDKRWFPTHNYKKNIVHILRAYFGRILVKPAPAWDAFHIARELSEKIKKILAIHETRAVDLGLNECSRRWGDGVVDGGICVGYLPVVR